MVMRMRPVNINIDWSDLPKETQQDIKKDLDIVRLRLKDRKEALIRLFTVVCKSVVRSVDCMSQIIGTSAVNHLWPQPGHLRHLTMLTSNRGLV